MRIGTCIASLLAILAAAPAVEAADLTTRQVIEALQRAAPDAPADFAGLDLKFLDLSELDFSRADLSGADLRSANLTGANFADADLSGVNLTRAIIIRANFSGANLSNASLYRPVTYSSVDAAPKEAPVFRGANFAGTRLVVHLIHADLSGADFTNARLELRREDQFKTPNVTQIWWSNLAGANLSGANLSGARHRDVGHALRRLVGREPHPDEDLSLRPDGRQPDRRRPAGNQPAGDDPEGRHGPCRARAVIPEACIRSAARRVIWTRTGPRRAEIPADAGLG